MEEKDRRDSIRDFIESLEALDQLKDKKKIVIRDLDREYFLAILDHYKLPHNKKLIRIFVNAIKRTKRIKGASIPNLIAAYIQMLLWDFFLNNSEKPFKAVMQGFWFGYTFREFIEFEIRDPPD